MNGASTATLSWLLTYALHSTVLLGGARVLTARRMSATARDLIWKVALVGGFVTATAQIGFAIRPIGSLSLPAVAAAPGATDAGKASVGLRDAGERAPSNAAKPRLFEAPVPTTGDAASARTSSISLADGLVIAWAVIGLMLAAVYGARRLILVGRLGDRRAVTGGRLPSMLAALQHGGRVRDVRLTASNSISSPVALGLSEICIPEAAITELEEEQQRGLLAHELAHLERRDPLWLDVASVVERIFFFQPLNRMARREMQLAAEHLCDDFAAARLGSGMPLARCLAQVAEWIQASPLGVPMAGMAEQRSHLVERIARLVDRGVAAKPASRALITAGALTILVAVVAAAPGVQSSVQSGTVSKAGIGAPGTLVGVREAQGVAGDGVQTDSAETEGAQKAQDPAVIAALIARLKDTDAGVRRAAASSLGNLKSRTAVPGLIGALDDKDREVREAAAHALGNLQDVRAVNPLLDLLRDPSAQVRDAAIGALENFDHEELSAGPFVIALRDQNAEVRHKAAHLLGNIRDRAATGALGIAAKDASPDVRQAAIEALGEIRDAASAGIISGAMSDENADVRRAAVQAIGELKVNVDRATMLALLGDASGDVRQAAVELTRERPFPGAAAALVKLIDDVNPDVRVGAVEAIAELHDPMVDMALKNALTSKDPKVRARAAEILGERRP